MVIYYTDVKKGQHHYLAFLTAVQHHLVSQKLALPERFLFANKPDHNVHSELVI